MWEAIGAYAAAAECSRRSVSLLSLLKAMLWLLSLLETMRGLLEASRRRAGTMKHWAHLTATEDASAVLPRAAYRWAGRVETAGQGPTTSLTCSFDTCHSKVCETTGR